MVITFDLSNGTFAFDAATCMELIPGIISTSPKISINLSTTSDSEKLTEEVDSLSAEKETLTAHIEVLATDLQEKTADIDQLAAEKGEMSNSIEEMSNNIEGLSAALDEKTGVLNELGESVEILKSSKDIAVEKIALLGKDISQQLGKIKELQGSLKDRSTVLSELVDKHATLGTKSQEVKTQRNILGWLFGGTTTGVTVWGLLSFYWKWRGKRKLY